MSEIIFLLILLVGCGVLVLLPMVLGCKLNKTAKKMKDLADELDKLSKE